MEMLENMKTVELRKLAGQMGIKGMSSARKEQLLPVITAKVDADHAEALALNTPAAPAKPKGKRCEICGTRPVGKEARKAGHNGYCDPCFEEAGHENQHSDDAHDEISNGADVEEFTGGQETVDRIRKEMKACWICHPELNKASETYVPRAGVARKGQKLHVTLRASGETKANETIAQLPEGTEVAVSTSKASGTVLTIKLAEKTLTLVWDAAGRYSYPNSVLSLLTRGDAAKGTKTRKIRNVSEALRIAAKG
jgi:hypothetical protein